MVQAMKFGLVGTNMQVNGNKEKEMELANSCIQMIAFSMENGETASVMDLESRSIQMGTNMKVTGKTVKRTVLVEKPGLKVILTQVIKKMVGDTVTVYILLMMAELMKEKIL